MRKLALAVLFVCLVLFNQVSYADQLSNYDDLSQLNTIEINNQIVINKQMIEDLEKENALAKKELVKSNKEIESLNQIVFFYSDKNITDVFTAVKNDEIETTPVLQFEDTKCGYPIYNGAQRKLDTLIRLRTKIAAFIKTNEETISNLKASNGKLADRKNQLEQKIS